LLELPRARVAELDWAYGRNIPFVVWVFARLGTTRPFVKVEINISAVEVVMEFGE